MADDQPSTKGGSGDGPLAGPSSVRTLLALAAAVVLLVGLWLARDIIGPLAVAAVIVMISYPIRRPLERRGWPGWLATAAVVVLSWGILLGLAWMIAWAGSRFVRLVTDYTDQLRAAVTDVVALLGQLGLDITAEAAAIFSPATILGLVSQLAVSGAAVLGALFFIFGYAIFMAADAVRVSRAERLYGPASAPTVRRFAGFTADVRKYYVVNAVFGVIVAVIDGLALWWLGVPAPLVWAILAFVTNFIPNIGFVLGLVPPAVLALIVGGWPLMLAVIAIYIVANVVLQVLVQPKFVSDAVSLSLTLSFFSVIFWTFVIGPLGAILSIPLTLLVRALLLDGDPSTRWLRWLSGDDAAGGSVHPGGGRSTGA